MPGLNDVPASLLGASEVNRKIIKARLTRAYLIEDGQIGSDVWLAPRTRLIPGRLDSPKT